MFAITTVLALSIAFVAAHTRILIGGIIVALWVLDCASGLIDSFVDAWPELKKPKLKSDDPKVE